jgi:hypothetical protein
VKSAKNFSYESVTEVDIRGERYFDVHACGVLESTITVADNEKVRIRLASNVLQLEGF